MSYFKDVINALKATKKRSKLVKFGYLGSGLVGLFTVGFLMVYFKNSFLAPLLNYLFFLFIGFLVFAVNYLFFMSEKRERELEGKKW